MSYLDTFNKLSYADGFNNKISILQSMDDFEKQLLKYAYEPKWKYHIKQIPSYIGGTESLTDINVFKLLDDLRTRRLTGNAAIEIVRLTLNCITLEDGQLLIKILKKDLRAGIGPTTIIKAIPGLINVFGIMRAESFNRVVPQSGLYASLKLDGLRCISTEGTMLTRNGHEIIGSEHILDELKYPSIDVDGEILVPNVHFQDSSGKIRSNNNCSNAVYYIFDIPSHTGTFEERWLELQRFYNSLHNPPHIKLVKHVKVNSLEKIDQFFNQALEKSYEGLVLKTPNHYYVRKRSSDWMKMKNVQSIDAPIEDVFEGEGKYEGSLGGVIILVDRQIVRVGSGFSDELRHEIWCNSSKYKGKMIEVDYHEKTPGGSLRHPRFKRFRPDKD